MRTLLLVALIALLPRPARAVDPWTWHDASLEVAFAAAVAIDVGQTTWALDQGYREANPMLGRHPTDARLRGISAAVVVGHAAVSALLPARARRWWQAISLGVELGAVSSNLTVGARISF